MLCLDYSDFRIVTLCAVLSAQILEWYIDTTTRSRKYRRPLRSVKYRSTDTELILPNPPVRGVPDLFTFLPTRRDSGYIAIG
jgi:hypothetical protein